MSRLKLVPLVVLFTLVGLAAGFLAIYLYLTHAPTAGIRIDSDPPSLVYIDGRQIGMTPVDQTFSPGEVSLLMVPQSGIPLPEFRTQLPLAAGTYSHVSRHFSQSSGPVGVTLYFHPRPGEEPSVRVLSSSPESVFVSLDGQSSGSSPVLLSSLTPGEHQLLLTAVGFQSKNLTVRVLEDHALTVDVHLEPVVLQPVAAASQLPPASASAVMVTILSTPTGFLRVREQPLTSSREITHVSPGETFPLIATSSGWFRISLDSSSSGWISSQYSRLTP